MSRIRHVLYLLLISVSLRAPEVSSAKNQPTQNLMRIMNSSKLDNERLLKEIAHRALDAGSEAIPALRDRLRKADRPEEKAIALTAIAYIGGPAAVSIIRS